MPAATRASPWTSLQLKLGVGAAARDRASAGALGGTSVLIAVGVALDTMRQMESQMMMRNYEGFLR